MMALIIVLLVLAAAYLFLSAPAMHRPDDSHLRG